MKILVILLLIFTRDCFGKEESIFQSFSNFKGTTGIVFTGKMESKGKSEFDKPIFSSSASIGLKGYYQSSVLLGLSFNISGFINYGHSNSEYNYTDENNITTKISQLGGEYKYFGISPGVRFHPINASFLKIYAGYGFTFGILELKYDKSEFDARNTTSASLLRKDDSGIVHPYLEAGVKIMFTKTSGVEFQTTKYEYETSSMKTLGNEKIDLKATQYAIMYIKDIK